MLEVARDRLYHARHPEKLYARSQAFYKVEIPPGQLCEECHNALATDRHHPDYNKPLEVSFLCTSCHLKKKKRGD